MATLETQYKNYCTNNPTIKLTQIEWFKNVLSPMVNKISFISDDFQIGPDGAYEDNSDWDITLEDGLDDLDDTEFGCSLSDCICQEGIIDCRK